METRPRKAVSFVSCHRVNQREGEKENPRLFKATHFNFILKGERIKNEIGNFLKSNLYRHLFF